MFRLRYRTRRQFKQLAAGVAVVAVLGLAGGTHHALAASHPAAAPAAQAKQAGQVIAFAESRLGCPYVWGGTGPCQSGYDCSGLVMEAFQSAGIQLERTSQDQWSSEQQVPAPARGDLVFFAGADGTTASPGHVGIVVNPGKHLMLDAYASGFPVEWDTYGLPGSKDGLNPVVGFTDPYAGAQP
jgi:cell wall-associated NlpC family hydrolase